MLFNSVYRQDIKIAILQMEGTNCEHESYLAFKQLETHPEYVHLKELEKKRKHIDRYQCIFIPGGFSAGDYIRAGAIFAARLKAHILEDLTEFICNGYPVTGFKLKIANARFRPGFFFITVVKQ